MALQHNGKLTVGNAADDVPSITIDVVDPRSADAQFCLNAYFAELAERFDTGFDAGKSSAPDVTAFDPPNGVMLVAWADGAPVACGGIKFPGDGTAEVKRVWVSSTVRGRGVARRLMAEIERRAGERASVVRLDTNKTLTEAIAMYRKLGYYEIDDFNGEPYAHHWFEKSLRLHP